MLHDNTSTNTYPNPTTTTTTTTATYTTYDNNANNKHTTTNTLYIGGTHSINDALLGLIEHVPPIIVEPWGSEKEREIDR